VSAAFHRRTFSRHRRRAWLRYPFVLRTAGQSKWLKPTGNSLAQSVATPVEIASTQGASSRITGAWPSLYPSRQIEPASCAQTQACDRVPGASRVAARISNSISRSRRTSAIVSPMCRSILESIIAKSSMPPPHQALPRPVIHASRPICHTDVFDSEREALVVPNGTSLARREGLADPPCAARKWVSSPVIRLSTRSSRYARSLRAQNAHKDRATRSNPFDSMDGGIQTIGGSV